MGRSSSGHAQRFQPHRRSSRELHPRSGAHHDHESPRDVAHRKLALISTAFSTDGFYPEMLPMQAAVGAQMADMMKDTPMYKSYAAIAPDPSEFPRLLDRLGEYMRQR